jgi:hypothetical protein
MKHFTNMVSTARTLGIVALGNADSLSMSDLPRPSELFYQSVEDARSIVVWNFRKVTEEDFPKSAVELDLPFQTVVIEGGDLPILNLTWKGQDESAVHAIMIREVSPRKYHFWLLMQVKGIEMVMELDPENPQAMTSFLMKVLSKVLEMLKSCDQGLEPVRAKIKIGDKAHKRTHVLSKCIHIRPRKLAIVSESLGLRNIDWTHRFEVRGHWRSNKGLGKDRNGEYNVEGFTWVVPHVKGSIDLPLIKKSRIVG